MDKAQTSAASGSVPDRPVFACTRSPRLGMVAVCTALSLPLPALAVDGCQLLLCLAAPSWRAIPECVPTVTQALRDLLRGRAFPACAMASHGNAATHAWSDAPRLCPPQYTWTYEAPHGLVYQCLYQGAISVTVQGVTFTTTWWSASGDAVTDFSPAAKAQLGQWDTRFDAEYTAWLAGERSGR